MNKLDKEIRELEDIVSKEEENEQRKNDYA
jgi:hypothetical protein